MVGRICNLDLEISLCSSILLFGEQDSFQLPKLHLKLVMVKFHGLYREGNLEKEIQKVGQELYLLNFAFTSDWSSKI